VGTKSIEKIPEELADFNDKKCENGKRYKPEIFTIALKRTPL